MAKWFYDIEGNIVNIDLAKSIRIVLLKQSTSKKIYEIRAIFDEGQYSILYSTEDTSEDSLNKCEIILNRIKNNSE